MLQGRLEALLLMAVERGLFLFQNIDNENLKDLLPQTILSGYDLRPICKHHNYICRTERFKNSFLPQSILQATVKRYLFQSLRSKFQAFPN